MLRPALLSATFAFALPLALTGCGDSEPSETTDGSEDSTSGGEDEGSGDTGSGLPWYQEQSEAFCAKLFSCECPSTPYADEAECITVVQEFYATVDAIGMDREDMSHNAECMGKLAAIADQYSCEDRAWPEDIITDCAVVHGDVPFGMRCDNVTAFGWYEQYSDCRTHLICDDTTGLGYCLERDPEPIAAGETCFTEPFTFECVEGYVCDHEQTQYCNPLPDTGSACISQTCNDTAWCDPTQGLGEGMCVGKVDEGMSCQRDEHCLSDFCDTGTCGPAREIPVLLCALPRPGA